VVVLFVIGTGGFSPTKLSRLEFLQMVFFLTTCLGVLAAWRWELLGGAMATASIVCFFAVEWMTRGAFPRSWVLALMPLPGVLFLLCWYLDRRPTLARRSQA
jgi:hypothetical protein